MSDLHRHRLSIGLIIWALIALGLFMLGAPAWLRIPITGSFVLLGVGIAVVAALDIDSLPLALGLAVAVGMSALVLSSLVPLFASHFNAIASVIIEVIVVLGLAAVMLSRPDRPLRFLQPRPDIGDET